MKLATLPLILFLLAACSSGTACSTTRPDVTELTGTAVKAGGGKNEQRMAHLSVPVTVTEDGDSIVSANRLGVDVQGAATAAANPVTIASLTGGNAAAAKILSTKTPEELSQGVRLARIQAALDRAETDLSIEEDEAKKASLRTRIAQLEGRESLAMARLAEIHTAKLDAASGLASDFGKLESIHYQIFAPQITTSGKAGSEATWAVAAAAFQEWIKKTDTAKKAKTDG